MKKTKQKQTKKRRKNLKITFEDGRGKAQIFEGVGDESFQNSLDSLTKDEVEETNDGDGAEIKFGIEGVCVRAEAPLLEVEKVFFRVLEKVEFKKKCGYIA